MSAPIFEGDLTVERTGPTKTSIKAAGVLLLLTAGVVFVGRGAWSVDWMLLCFPLVVGMIVLAPRLAPWSTTRAAPAKVIIDERGLLIDGRVVASSIARARPRFDRELAVRIELATVFPRRPIVLVAASRESRDALLDALVERGAARVSEATITVSFGYGLFLWCAAQIVLTVVVGLALLFWHLPARFIACSLLGGFGHFLWSWWRPWTRIIVGRDGVRVDRRFEHRFFSFAKIRRVVFSESILSKLCDDEGNLVVGRETRGRSRCVIDGEGGEEAWARLASCVAAASDAYDADRENEADESALLFARRGRSVDAWLAELRRHESPTAYREHEVDAGELLRLLGDPAAQRDVRAGAAVALHARIGAEARRQIRVALAETASPRLRAALRAVGEEADEETLKKRLEALARGTSIARLSSHEA